MGSSFSKQEELFVQCQWGELVMLASQEALEAAMAAANDDGGVDGYGSDGRDGASDSEDDGGAKKSRRQRLKDTLVNTTHRLQQHHANRRNGNASGGEFKMTSQEWQAIMCLAEEVLPSEAPSMVLSASSGPSSNKGPTSSSSSPFVTLPFIACLSHIAGIAEGTLTVQKGLERLMGLRELTMVANTTADDDASGKGDVMRRHEPMVGIVYQMAQSVYLRQYGNDGRVPMPTLPNGGAARKGTAVDKKRQQHQAVSTSPMALGASEVIVVLEDALRLRARLSQSLRGDGGSGVGTQQQRHNGSGSNPPASWEGRPVYGFACSVINALVLCGAVDCALRLISLGGVDTAGHHAGEGKGEEGGPPTMGRIVSCVAKVLLEALGELQRLETAMVKAGYKPSAQAAAGATGSSGSGRGLCGDFCIVGRIEASLQAKLLVVDLARMRLAPVLLPPPTRPRQWADLPKSYIGQHALQKVISRHYIAKARGVVEDNKPTVLLFFGPSGHGKSELAKTIAKILHPMSSDVEGEGKLVMIHLPSFCTKDSIYSLVDPPAAHVGEGMLLSALRREPGAVVVLDEFEKSTADSIQNLWLSAFQKDGMLRSLKDSARSTTTTKCTFILTCNLCDDVIQSSEAAYLAANPADQERLRTAYTEQCREVVRQRFGDPFLNRIDFFLPFVPYSVEEKKDFASLQLSAIASQQFLKHRRLLVPTPSYLMTIAASTRNFHTCSVAQQAQEVLMEFPLREEEGEGEGLAHGESTVENSIVRFAHSMPCVSMAAVRDAARSPTGESGTTSGAAVTLISGAYLGSSKVLSMDRATLKERLLAVLGGTSSTASGDGAEGGAEALGGRIDAFIDVAIHQQADALLPPRPKPKAVASAGSSTTASRSGGSTVGSPIPAAAPLPSEGTASAAAADTATAPAPRNDSVPEGAQGAQSSFAPQQPPMNGGGTGSSNSGASLRRRGQHADPNAGSDDAEKELLLQTVLEVATVKDVDTDLMLLKDKEIERLRAVVVAKDVELKTMKETIKAMEKVIAVLLVFVMASALLLSLVVGMKLALILVVMCGLSMYMIVDNFVQLLGIAVRALYGLLGPAKTGALVASLLGYVAWAAQSGVPPCPVP